MKRWLLAAAAVAAAAAAAVALRYEAVPASPGPRPSPAVPRARPAVTSAFLPSRNVFEYFDGARRGSAAEPPPPSLPLLIPPATLSPEAKLVGLVRKAGRLKAAVSIRGEVVVLGPGETAEGYTVLSVDEDGRVRLRGPDHRELELWTPAR